jgi:Protein of unknown function (DUF3618)
MRRTAVSEVSTQAKHRADGVSPPVSPDELEHEIEATRERLADTLDQLLYRVKPGTIISRQVQQTKAHFVDAEGKVRVDKVAAVAAAAVGVVVFFAVVRRLSNRKG